MHLELIRDQERVVLEDNSAHRIALLQDVVRRAATGVRCESAEMDDGDPIDL
jgi:hypothetical protein